MLRSRILTGLVVAAFAGIFGSQLASCTLDQEGGTEVDTGKACTTDANCDDKNPCTTDTCPKDTLVCQYAKQASGAAPDSVQTPNDCKSIVCNAGAPSTQDDPQDFINDNNSCTLDACTNGAPTNVAKMDGSPCMVGTKSGTCGAGSCKVSCANNNDCNDNDPCSEDLCNTSAGICVFTYLDGVPTPGFMQIAGDCKVQFCEAGINTELNDDADLPDDGNSCTTDVCTAGVPSNPAVGPSTPCTLGDTMVCNGSGACVECVVPSDCVGITETECEKRNCVNNKCEIAYEGQTTLASPVLQNAKDCKKVVCNGPNGTTEVNDDTDLPDDTNACTTDTCSNGMKVFTNKSQGTPCGATGVCNATGGCVGCNSPADCGVDDFCTKHTCVSNMCGITYTPNGTDLPAMNSIMNQTPGDCKVIQCNGSGGIKTVVRTSDVPVDSNDCTDNVCSMGGQPSNPNSPLNSPCSSNGGDVCNGAGVCKKSNGKTCSATGDCLSNFCVDGYCCNNACTTDCQSCNLTGKLGTCSDVPAGTQDGTCVAPMWTCNTLHDCDLLLGQNCGNSDSACLSNFCADSVCCNEACTAACKVCNLMSSNGTCTNVPSGMPDNFPVGVCSGMNQCDGMGTCKQTNGTMCTTNGQCFSGICADGYCCNMACSTTCNSCAVSGMLGSCVLVPAGNDPDSDCAMQSTSTCGTTGSCNGSGACTLYDANTECISASCSNGVQQNQSKCNGTGMCVDAGTVTCGTYGCGATTCKTSCMVDGDCASGNYCETMACVGKKSNGQACVTSNQCTSGFCIDNICCSTACTGQCQVCGAGGTCGTLMNGNDTNSTPTCSTTMTCDASGQCKKVNGQVCTGTNDCLSGNCVDGYCCNSMCTTQCQGCGVPNSLGMCVNLPLNTDDTNAMTTCTGTKTCNGSGQCKDKAGQPCSGGGTCASGNCNNNMCQ